MVGGLGSVGDLRPSRAQEGGAEVADVSQHQGIGSVLLQHLAAIARAAGLATFVADVLAENVALHRAFLARSGFYPTVRVTGGEVLVRLEQALTEVRVAV